MEGKASEKVGDESLDDYSSSLFQCCVCLDLLYKPLVLPCGHMSCFWCVHKAMHNIQESNCAICRQSYQHFPSICQLLHLLISKLEPSAYSRREKEVIEEEKQREMESPQFAVQVSAPEPPSETKTSNEDDTNGFQNSKNKISINDVSCCMCNELLYLPSVLNCGHVYCEGCLLRMSGERLCCKTCQSPHPGEFPNVCLDLDHFIEENFPKQYSLRKQNSLIKKSKNQTDASSSSSSQEKIKSEVNLFLTDEMYNVHIGVGCDTCGLYPIKGKRYKCVDCKEAVGFDLCEECYLASQMAESKLPGRFNQQHTPEHKFVLDDTNLLSRIFLARAIDEEDYEDELENLEGEDEDEEQYDGLL